MSNYVRYITVTDNDPDNFEKIIKVAKSCYKYYWYIYHDSDLDDNGSIKKKHLHLVCYDSSPATIQKAIKNFEGCTLPNLVEAVRNGRAMLRYLIHKDDSDKFQYNSSLVQTNNIGQFLEAIGDFDNVYKIWQDYELVRTAKISVGEFIEKYKQNLSGMNFYQQLSTFNLLHKTIYKE